MIVLKISEENKNACECIIEKPGYVNIFVKGALKESFVKLLKTLNTSGRIKQTKSRKMK